MDKFIEVTESDELNGNETRFILNALHISSFHAFKGKHAKTLICMSNSDSFRVKETYEEIKEKITGR